MVRRSGVVLVLAAASCLTPNDVGSGDTDDGSSGGASSSSAGTASTTAGTNTASSTGSTGGSDSTDTTSEPGTDTNDGPTCAEGGNRCVDEAPEGWAGPVAWLPDTDPDRPSCGGVFPLSETEAFASVDDPGLVCDCACDDPAGGACDPTIGVNIYNVDCNAEDSNGFCIAFNTNFNGCNSLSGSLDVGTDTYEDSDNYGIRIRPSAPSVATAPTCAEMVTAELPDVEPAGHVELCGVNEVFEGSCATGETCVPSPANPYSVGLCVWSDGDVACPEGTAYTERQVVYTGIDDTRACSECTCGDAIGVSCDADVSVVTSYIIVNLVLATDPAESYDADGGCSPVITPNSTPILEGADYEIDYDSPDPTSSGCNPPAAPPAAK